MVEGVFGAVAGLFVWICALAVLRIVAALWRRRETRDHPGFRGTHLADSLSHV
jgi:hypothetical protein